ncbi:MAG: hypothetical protein ABI823_13835 [Bryobacteraceae bacterium]
MKTLIVFLLSAMMALGADISGKWMFEVTTDQGSGTPSFEFKQAGDKLAGTYKGAFGEGKLEGSVKGDAVQFTVTTDNGKIVYTGTLDGATKIKGKVDLAGIGTGTFTGTKQ